MSIVPSSRPRESSERKDHVEQQGAQQSAQPARAEEQPARQEKAAKRQKAGKESKGGQDGQSAGAPAEQNQSVRDKQADKQDRLGARHPLAAEVRFVATDFVRTGLGEALEAAGHRPDLPTTWVWEGVVVYLTEEQVRATLEVIGARSSGGARLVVNYQAPSARAILGKLLAQVLMRVSGRRDVWRDEPHRSRWSAGRIGALVGEHGFVTVRDDDLGRIARDLGLSGDAVGPSLADGRVSVADRR